MKLERVVIKNLNSVNNSKIVLTLQPTCLVLMVNYTRAVYRNIPLGLSLASLLDVSLGVAPLMKINTSV